MFASFQNHNASAAAPMHAATFFTGQVAISRNQFFKPVIQRQPASDETKSTADELAELNRSFDEARQSLCELALELFKAGYTGGTQGTINGETVNVLDALMSYEANCGSLAPFITLKPASLSQGHYKTYRHQRSDDFLGNTSSYDRFDANEWHRAVKAYLPNISREETTKIGGFYNRRNDTVNLPSDSSFGNALHESVHLLSSAMFKGRVGNYLNEGVTQLFADVILNDVGLPAATGHNYGLNVADARLLEQKGGGRALLAQAYFQGSNDAIQQILVNLHLIPDTQTIRAIREQELLTAIRS